MLITAFETVPDGQLTFVSSVGITLVYSSYREALQSAVSVARSNHRHLEKNMKLRICTTLFVNKNNTGTL